MLINRRRARRRRFGHNIVQSGALHGGSGGAAWAFKCPRQRPAPWPPERHGIVTILRTCSYGLEPNASTRLRVVRFRPKHQHHPALYPGTPRRFSGPHALHRIREIGHRGEQPRASVDWTTPTGRRSSHSAVVVPNQVRKSIASACWTVIVELAATRSSACSARACGSRDSTMPAWW